jgi:hypothetical protein
MLRKLKNPNSFDFVVFERYWSFLLGEEYRDITIKIVCSSFGITIEELDIILHSVHQYKMRKTVEIYNKLKLNNLLIGQITNFHYDPPTDICGFTLVLDDIEYYNHDCTIIFYNGFICLPYSREIVISVYKKDLHIVDLEKIFSQHFLPEDKCQTTFGL